MKEQLRLSLICCISILNVPNWGQGVHFKNFHFTCVCATLQVPKPFPKWDMPSETRLVVEWQAVVVSVRFCNCEVWYSQWYLREFVNLPCTDWGLLLSVYVCLFHPYLNCNNTDIFHDINLLANFGIPLFKPVNRLRQLQSYRSFAAAKPCILKLTNIFMLLTECNKSYACGLTTYPARFYCSNLVWERDHTKVKRIIMSQLRLRMVWPWLGQLDQFWCLCAWECS